MDETQKRDDITGEEEQPQNQNAEMAPRNDTCEKCEEYIAGWKRAQADYQNLKKEMQSEKVEYAKYANERLLSDLLPTLDQFDLAIQHLPDASSLPDEEKKRWESWLVGLKAVGTLWEQAAKGAGLERISVEGMFDPIIHEAVGQESKKEKKPGSIIHVTQAGWILNGKIIRPAKVVIVADPKANT